MTDERGKYRQLHNRVNRMARDPKWRVLAFLQSCIAECDKKHSQEEIAAAAAMLGIRNYEGIKP